MKADVSGSSELVEVLVTGAPYPLPIKAADEEMFTIDEPTR